MALEFNTALRTKLLNDVGFKTLFTACKLQWRTGGGPGVNVAADGTLLVEMTALNFAVPSEGVIAKTGTWSANATAGGTAGYFRIIDTTDTYWIQGTIGVSSGDMRVASTTITSGAAQTLTTFSFTFPES